MVRFLPVDVFVGFVVVEARVEVVFSVVFSVVVGDLIVVGGGIEGLVFNGDGIDVVVAGSSVGFAKMLHLHLLGTTVKLTKTMLKGCINHPYLNYEESCST